MLISLHLQDFDETPMPTPTPRPARRQPRLAFQPLEPRLLLAAVNANILVVYNAGFTADLDANGVQDSLQVAQYYAQKRGVPAANLLGLNPSSTTQVTYAQFKTEVAQPIQDKLVALGKANINYILMIYGMPWKLDSSYSLDNALISPEYSLTRTGVYSISNPYLELNPQYTTAGVYDAGASDKGHFTHASTNITGGYPIYLVSRLDGPVDTSLGITRILNLVDQALYAEKYISLTPGFLNGTMYVSSPYSNSFTLPTTDTDIKGGVYTNATAAQKNIGYAARYAELFGMPWKNLAASNKNAFLYSGWLNYSYYNQNFPKTYQWLPGGTGVDLNSYSLGYDIRAVNNTGSFAWGVQALADGITGLAGVTTEPFTTGHTRPNTFAYYLLKGYTFGEAASLANPNVGWMEMTIGDPLYAPFAPKTDLLDTAAPVFAPGFPKVTWKSREGYVVDVLLDDQANPEAATVNVEYGLTPAYGQSKELTQFYLHHRVALSDLQDGVTYHYRVIATDPAGNVTVSPDATFQTNPQTPHGPTPWPVPGTIQFEDYDNGGEGIAYHDVEPQDVINYNNPRPNEGVEITYYAPTSLWQVRAGEWLEYTVNVPQSGTYSLDVNSQADSAGNQFHFEVDGADVTGTLSSPAGAFGITSKSGIFLAAGNHGVRIRFAKGVGDGLVGYFDWFKFNFVAPAATNVTGVYLRGASWTPSFLDYLATSGQGDALFGYEIPVGSSAQLNSLPWNNLNQLSIRFSANVTASQAALALTGNNLPAYPTSGFSYDATAHVATWTFASPLTPDHFSLTLSSALVTDPSANPLDGEWTDSVSTTSGNGAPGGDFTFTFNLLPADANHDNIVNFADFVILSNNYGAPNRGPAGADFNGDGQTSFADFVILSNNYGASAANLAATPTQTTALATRSTHPTTSTPPKRPKPHPRPLLHLPAK
jgi:uncharacterized protein (TIGR03790 family)